jgi:hypothetical protein
METYAGDVDEVIATSAQGDMVGFIKRVGAGHVMMFGAALPANTIEDLDILDHMATRFGCPPLFSMSAWADVRLSQGENGSFLFVNNYQDDPVSTLISMNGKSLLGGHPVSLAARRGVILPLEWHIAPGVTLHYCTAEITDISHESGRLIITTEPAEYIVEVSAMGYLPDGDTPVSASDDARFTMRGQDGKIILVSRSSFT